MIPIVRPFLLPSFLFVATFLTLTFKELLFVGIFAFDYYQFRDVFFAEYPYSVTLIMILLCHEMGHYIPARISGISATLPYFIPFPFGPIGTMGAVIKIKDRIPDKTKLFDIGVGGPAMSLFLSIIAWIVGLHFSELVRIPEGIARENLLFFGDSLFTKWSAQLVFGTFDPEIFDIQIHPLARAGWVGLLITAINMLPFGQLDGGHVIYAVFGESYRKWIHWLFLIFCLLSLWNVTWMLWGFIIYFLIKIEHPVVPDGYPFLDPKRKVFGILMLFAFVLIFVPEPLVIGSDFEKANTLELLWNFLKLHLP